LGSSIIPLTFDDDNPDMEGNDAACVAFPWLVSTGFTLVFSALFSKIWRINKILTASRTFRRINVTHGDVLAPLLATLSMNFVLLLIWTLVDPPQWVRVDVTEFESYGICSTGEGVASTVIVSLLLALNFLCVVITNIQAYKTREVSDEFSESKYIALAMISIMQIFLVGVPLVFLTTNNPTACFFVITSMILVITMSVLMCLFVPKFRRVYKRYSRTGVNSRITVFNTNNRSGSSGRQFGASIGTGSSNPQFIGTGSSNPQFNGPGSSSRLTAVQFKDSMNEQPMVVDLAMGSMHVNAASSNREVSSPDTSNHQQQQGSIDLAMGSMVVNGATSIQEQSFAELDEVKTESSNSNQTPVSGELKLKKPTSNRSSTAENSSTSKRTPSSIRSSIGLWMSRRSSTISATGASEALEESTNSEAI